MKLEDLHFFFSSGTWPFVEDSDMHILDNPSCRCLWYMSQIEWRYWLAFIQLGTIFEKMTVVREFIKYIMEETW